MSKPKWMREVDEDQARQQAARDREREAKNRQREQQQAADKQRFTTLYNEWNGRVRSGLKEVATHTLGRNWLGLRWHIKGGVDEQNFTSCSWSIYTIEHEPDYNPHHEPDIYDLDHFTVSIYERGGRLLFNGQYPLTPDGLQRALQDNYRGGPSSPKQGRNW